MSTRGDNVVPPLSYRLKNVSLKLSYLKWTQDISGYKFVVHAAV